MFVANHFDNWVPQFDIVAFLWINIAGAGLWKESGGKQNNPFVLNQGH
jgi:hypothetical protein